MKRENKFRAWSILTKSMSVPVTLEVWCITVGGKFTELKKYWTIMEYTGLKNKNGKEIYEGDIINVEKANEFGSHEYVNLAVIYCDHEGNWSLTKTPENVEKTHYIMGGKVNNFKVIGNIYENKELLT